jgi:HEAT repeat protein
VCSSDLLNVRAQAAAALGKIGDMRAVPAITARLADENAGVRVQAAQALGVLKVQSSMPMLTERLYDDYWWVRFRAAEALYLLGAPGLAVLHSFQGAQDDAGVIARQILGEKSV